MAELLEILKYTIPGLIVFATAYMLLKAQYRKEEHIQLIKLKDDHHRVTLPVRLQAYERLTLFMERCDFSNLIPRVRQPEMDARDLQLAIITSIRAEYEHNLTQQLYVSGELWRKVVLSKEEIIKVVNLVGGTMPTDASGNVLSRALFQYVIDSEEGLPVQETIEYIRAEARSLF